MFQDMSDEYFDHLDQQAHTAASHHPGPITPPTPSDERPRVQATHLCVGCIVWLPPRDFLNGEIKCVCESCPTPEELDEGGYNHPIVVLKIRQAINSKKIGDLVCDVACLTTFSDISITRYQARKSKADHFRDSISIAHLDSETFHGKQLTLEKEGKLHKQSYVRLKHVYQIEVSKLRVYRWKRKAHSLRLDESSYGDLMETLGLLKEEWEDTESLLETATRRLGLLAKSNTRQSSEIQPAETTVRVQTPRTPGDFNYYNDQPSWLTSSTNPQSRQDSTTSTPVTPQSAALRAYYDRLADQANTTRNSARHTPPVPSPQPHQQPRSYYNPPTWSHTATVQAQRNYGAIPQSSRPDRYVQTRNSYIPPRPEPEKESSGWLFVKCLVGFVAIGGLWWWWDAKYNRK